MTSYALVVWVYGQQGTASSVCLILKCIKKKQTNEHRSFIDQGTENSTGFPAIKDDERFLSAATSIHVGEKIDRIQERLIPIEKEGE